MSLPSGDMHHMSINNREKLPKSCWRAREDNLEINTCHSPSIKQVSCMGKCCLSFWCWWQVGLLSSCGGRLLIAVASLVVEHRL